MKIPAICRVQDLLDLTRELIKESDPALTDEPELAFLTQKHFFAKLRIYLDKPEELNIDSTRNGLAEKYIIKRQQEGGCEIETQGVEIESESVQEILEQHSRFFNTALMVSSTPKDVEIAYQFGLVCINRLNWRISCSKLTMQKSITCTDNRYNQLQSWDTLGDHLFKTRNLYLVDRYLLKRNSIFENNLFSLIQALISDEAIGTKIKLVTAPHTPTNTVEESQFQLLFNEKFGDDISLEIKYVSPHLFHTREILGDYFYVLVDNSFYIFDENNKVKRNRRVKIVVYGLLSIDLNQYEENVNNIMQLTDIGVEA